VKQAQALFDSSVASYRETVLTAFQQVEDDLAALRILADESAATALAVKAAKEALDISTYQYKAGTVNYLQVITSQAAYLGAEETAVNLLARRMVSSVLLIQAMGGGWDNKNIPSASDLTQSR
jgi:outer membrane protein TolC